MHILIAYTNALFFCCGHAGSRASRHAYLIGFNNELSSVFILGLVATVTRNDSSLCLFFLHIPTIFTHHASRSIILPNPGSNRDQSETQNRLEGIGPYGATLKQGLLSKPLTKSEIEIKGNVEDSVVGTYIQNEGMIEFGSCGDLSRQTKY
ncbi:hypothetical protein F4824DRAFT_476773 [Ustulina deusta]|nr:hypothetical protein F4824DRAFT_476773 [Ustulina deusta]